MAVQAWYVICRSTQVFNDKSKATGRCAVSFPLLISSLPATSMHLYYCSLFFLLSTLPWPKNYVIVELNFFKFHLSIKLLYVPIPFPVKFFSGHEIIFTLSHFHQNSKHIKKYYTPFTKSNTLTHNYNYLMGTITFEVHPITLTSPRNTLAIIFRIILILFAFVFLCIFFFLNISCMSI